LVTATSGLFLEPRAAQFRVEMRLLAETLQLGTRVPAMHCLAAAAVGARVIFYFCELMLTSATIQVGLAPPMAVYLHRVSFSGLINGQYGDRPVARAGGAVGIRGSIHWLQG